MLQNKGVGSRTPVERRRLKWQKQAKPGTGPLIIQRERFLCRTIEHNDILHSLSEQRSLWIPRSAASFHFLTPLNFLLLVSYAIWVSVTLEQLRSQVIGGDKNLRSVQFSDRHWCIVSLVCGHSSAATTVSPLISEVSSCSRNKKPFFAPSCTCWLSRQRKDGRFSYHVWVSGGRKWNQISSVKGKSLRLCSGIVSYRTLL